MKFAASFLLVVFSVLIAPTQYIHSFFDHTDSDHALSHSDADHFEEIHHHCEILNFQLPSFVGIEVLMTHGILFNLPVYFSKAKDFHYYNTLGFFSLRGPPQGFFIK